MIHVKDLGLAPYSSVWESMKHFTQARDEATPDEIWLLEHPPVYTQGQAGKPEHILWNTGTIPIVQSDRGGQVTYHGPGQLIMYVLIDLRRRHLGIRTLVTQLEQVIIQTLKPWEIQAECHCGAPGVYVGDQKIASIGLRVKNGCTYHGLALNVDMDLAPFTHINPCGFSQLKMIQMKDWVHDISMDSVKRQICETFLTFFET
jgi:lipoyl(octanoyl) transferase